MYVAVLVLTCPIFLIRDSKKILIQARLIGRNMTDAQFEIK